MLSIDEYRRILGRDDLSDAEIEEFRTSLQHFLGKFLDDYFRDEFEPDDV